MCKHSFDQLNLSFSHFHGLENFWQSWFMSLHHNIFLQFHKLPVPKRKNVHLLLKLCIVVQCHTTFSVCLVVQCHNTSKLCLVVWCHTITWAFFPFNVRRYVFTRFHKKDVLYTPFNVCSSYGMTTCWMWFMMVCLHYITGNSTRSACIL